MGKGKKRKKGGCTLSRCLAPGEGVEPFPSSKEGKKKKEGGEVPFYPVTRGKNVRGGGCKTFFLFGKEGRKGGRKVKGKGNKLTCTSLLWPTSLLMDGRSKGPPPPSDRGEKGKGGGGGEKKKKVARILYCSAYGGFDTPLITE